MLRDSIICLLAATLLCCLPAVSDTAPFYKVDSAKVTVMQYGPDDKAIGAASELTDGNARSRWICRTPVPPLRLGFDLGTACLVSKIRIANYYTGQNFNRGFKVVDIFVGDTLAPVTGGTPAVAAKELKISDAAGPGWTDILLDKPVKGRIVTIRVQSNWGGQFYAANEVEIYSQEADGAGTVNGTPVASANNPPTLQPGKVYSFTYPWMPQTFYAQQAKNEKPAMMTVYLPTNYDPQRKFPVLIFLNGGDGGDGSDPALARALAGGKDFICVALPLFKVDTKDYVIRDEDCTLMWQQHKQMLARLTELVPNIDPDHRILGGFSNGAHSVGGLIDCSNGEAAKWFSAFIVVEGAGRTQRYDLIKGKPLLICYGYQPGRDSPRARVKEFSAVAIAAGVNVTVHEIPNSGHAFPPASYPFLLQWLRDIALK